MLQRTGSFKFRGAFNKLSSIPQSARGGGVVAFSSGNHAQGVAAAARLLNMQATIVMPSDAPLSKRERTKGYGAEVLLYDRDREDREAIARDIAGKRGATLVPPYDDPFVIAGQGTIGLEIAEDMAALGVVPDIVVAPASGGGLLAGIATAVKARYPQAAIMSAEPEGFDDHARSLRAGKREPHRAEGRTICDALMASIPGEITFAINERLLAGGVTASDAEVGTAVGFVFRELKLVVEPGGAVGLAALLAGRNRCAWQNHCRRIVRRQRRCGFVRKTDRLNFYEKKAIFSAWLRRRIAAKGSAIDGTGRRTIPLAINDSPSEGSGNAASAAGPPKAASAARSSQARWTA